MTFDATIPLLGGLFLCSIFYVFLSNFSVPNWVREVSSELQSKEMPSWNLNDYVNRKFHLKEYNANKRRKLYRKQCKKNYDETKDSNYELQSREFFSRIVSQRPSLGNVCESLRANDWLVNLVESTLLFLDDIQRCTTLPHLMTSIMRYVKMITSESLTVTILNCEIFKRLLADVEVAFEVVEEDVEVQNFEEGLGVARESINTFMRIKGSQLYKKIYKLIMFLLSYSIFDKLGLNFDNLGYTVFEAEAIKKKFHDRTDFMLVLVDTFTFLLEKGVQIISTGRVDVLFHSGKVYAEWFETATKLMRQSKLLANPEAHGFDEYSFRAELDDVIEKGESMVRVATDLEASEKRFLRSFVNDLHMVKCDITTKQAAREHRTPPLSLLICGDSGIGKSTIKDMLFYHFAKVKKLGTDSHFCYTRNPAAKFWDGFTTSSWCIVLDDVAFMNPNKAPNGDPSVMEFLQVINAVPFVPDQADLSDKGRTPVKAKLCLATTNTENLNAHYYFSCASAAQRRFPYIIIPSVKREYLGEDNMLDSSKVPEFSGYTDVWHWKIKRVTPVSLESGGKLARTDVVFETDDINVFMKWYTKIIFDFDRNQNIVSASVEKLKHLVLCETCYLPECECEVQSFVPFTLGFLSSWFMNFCIMLLWHDVFMFLFTFTGVVAFQRLHYMAMAYFTGQRSQEWILRNTRRFINLGKKIQSHYTGTNVMIMVAAVSGLLTLYKISRKVETQGGVESVGVTPKPHADEKQNVWYKDDIDLTSFDLTPNTTSSKGLTHSQFCGILSMNCAAIRVHTRPGKAMNGHLTCLRGNVYFTNNHTIPVSDTMTHLNVVFQSSKDGITTNIDFSITEDQIVRYPECDICVLTIHNIPPKKGIYNYLPKSPVRINLNGFYYGRNLDGSIETNALKRIRESNRDVPLEGWQGRLLASMSEKATVNGDCGNLLVAQSEYGYIVAGAHVLACSLSKEVYAIVLHQQLFKNHIDGVIQSGEPTLSAPSAPRHLVDLHPKSIFRFIPSGSASLYGSFLGFRGKSKSSVELTPLMYALSPEGYKIKYGPPEMSSWEPWRIAAVDMLQPVNNINSNLVEHCVESYLTDILRELPENALDDLQIYDDFTAVNGAAGVTYVDKMKRNTSAGNPWKKSKKFFITSIPPEHGLQDPVEVDAEVMDRVRHIEDVYHAGMRAHPNFCAHLKDEPVTFKKMKMKKTRVFTGAPMDWSIVVRKYLLCAVRLIQNNRYVFEAAPGTTAQSLQWTQMYKYITKFGEHRIVAGDYKSFDKRMSPIFIKAAFSVLFRLCDLSGNYNEEDLKVLTGITNDTAYPLIDYNGDLVEFYGSNPSGHPLTVIINSIVNSLYMRYVYAKLNPRATAADFRQNVSLMTYGDDNIMSVNPNIDWYDHSQIAHAFDTMGITYTMADKEAISIPFINISDASFLKRSWRFDGEMDAYMPPLDHDSIEKSLMVWTRSKAISREEQTIEIVSSAVREYFFYGKEVFSYKSLMLRKALKKIGIDEWILPSTFPSWEELKNEFLTHSL